MISKLTSLCSQLNYSVRYGLFRREFLKPTTAIDQFNDLEVPSNVKFIILDKDNCFAKPHSLEVWPPFRNKWSELLSANGKKYEVRILSNTAGDATNDPNGVLARELEGRVGVEVLRHEAKKPMCYAEVAKSLPCHPHEILVVGDRLLTDVMFANLMGARSVWIRPGVHPSFLNHAEIWYYKMLRF